MVIIGFCIFIFSIFQVTIIYDALSLERFKKIIPFYNTTELERFLVDISKHRSIRVAIFVICAIFVLRGF